MLEGGGGGGGGSVVIDLEIPAIDFVQRLSNDFCLSSSAERYRGCNSLYHY